MKREGRKIMIKLSPIWHRLWIAVLCASISTVVIAKPSAVGAAPSDDLKAANQALFNGDYEKATALFTSVAAADVNLKCEALFGLGVTMLRVESYDMADKAFTRSLTECPP